MYPSFQLFGERIYSYALLIGVAWGIAYNIALIKKPDDFKKFKLFITGLFIFVWVGAKLLFLFSLNSETKNQIINSTSFWLGGGFVFYGGLLAGLVYLFIWKKIYKIKSFNFLIVPLCLGHSIGRVACFLAGCCYGSETTSLISVHLHQANRHPVQIYESLALLIFGVFFYNRKVKAIHYLAFYSVLRFSLEFVRADIIRGFGPLGLSTSQIVSLAILILIGVKQVLSQKIPHQT